MRRCVSWLMLFAVGALAAGLTAGCGDDYKTVQKTETIEQSDAQPVPPGDMIVE